MASPLECGTQDGTDPPSTDDADVEPSWSLCGWKQVTHARNASVSGEHVAFDP